MKTIYYQDPYSGRGYEIEDEGIDGYSFLRMTCKDILRYIRKYKLTGTHYKAISNSLKKALKKGE